LSSEEQIKEEVISEEDEILEFEMREIINSFRNKDNLLFNGKSLLSS
jgi:hypothetical protein